MEARSRQRGFGGAARAGVLAFVLALAGRGAVQIGDLLVSPVPAPSVQTGHGYFVHRVWVENRDGSRPHAVELLLQGGGRYSAVRRVRRRVVVGPGMRAQVSLPVPSLRVGGVQLYAVVDGEVEAVPLPYSPHMHMARRMAEANCPLVVLVSRSLNSDDLNLALRHKLSPTSGGGPPRRTPRHGVEHELARVETGLEDWSPDWLAYTCYDGVAVSAVDLREMRPEAREGVWRWVECGGALLVVGEPDVPGRWGERSDPSRWTANGVALTELPVGFGRCLWLSAAGGRAAVDLKALPKAHLVRIRDAWRHSQAPWHRVGNASDAHGQFPVIESVSVPYVSIFLFVVAFALLAGPVNVVVLARLNRRIWLLWTTPALAAVASLIVIAYGFLSEGVTPTIRTEGLTLLDQSTRRASTLAFSGFYCPLSPLGGLHYGTEVEVIPRMERFRRRSFGGSRSLDWTNHQHLTDGWVSPRIPAYFMLRISEARAERVELRPDGRGGLTAINGLGAPIRRLTVADREAAVYVATNVAAGELTVLERTDVVAGLGEMADLREYYTTARWMVNGKDLPDALRWLMPGSYVAVLDACPFIPNGLARSGHETTASVVLGLFDTSEGTP